MLDEGKAIVAGVEVVSRAVAHRPGCVYLTMLEDMRAGAAAAREAAAERLQQVRDQLNRARARERQTEFQDFLGGGPHDEEDDLPF